MNVLKSAPGADPIVIETWFAAAPARVFKAFTDPAIVQQWFGPVPGALHSASIDLRRGGAWQFVESHTEERSIVFEGRYLDIEPDARLVFTWSKVTVLASGERQATDLSEVAVTFTASDGGTAVHLVHSAVTSEPVRRGFGRGWSVGLGNLKAVLEARAETS